MNASKNKHLDIEIIRIYNTGKSVYEIARIFGIKPRGVYYRLDINDVKKRSISEALVGKPKSEAHRRATSRVRIEKGLAKGSRNPKWQGGITDEMELIRKSREYELWRKAVYERDNYTCQMCGYDKGHILHAHHIERRETHPELTLAIDNGITLCKYCHQKVHSKKWAKILRGELLENPTVKSGIISSRALFIEKVQRLCTPPERDDIVSSA